MSRVAKPDDETLKMRVSDFKADIAVRNIREAVQKHITYGSCCLLPEDIYFELKREIADEFSLHPSEVMVVGSAKLGFSIAPKKRYQLFNDGSDIDVALVAPQLFEQIWTETYVYKEGGAFWPKYGEFCEYLFQGWIRPDKLPPSTNRSEHWWEYFRALTREGKYGPFKIGAGLYKSWHFLENYQRRCVEQCKNSE